MRIPFPGVTILLLCMLISCTDTGEQTRYADDTIYYFQIVDGENSARSKEFTKRLIRDLPSSKYTITHQSGKQGWPFYRSYSLDAKLPVDSITPPHLIFHVLKPLDESTKPADGSYLIKAHLLTPVENNDPVLKFEMFIGESNDWKRVVNLDDHSFSSKKYPTPQDQYRIIQETIIRSSFK